MISRRMMTAGGFSGLACTRCGIARGQNLESVIARVRRTKTVRFGVVNGQPPYCYKDIATGAWRGFLVDITRDLASGLGAEAQPVESTWGNAVLDVQANKLDLFFGLAPTAERAKVVDFTKSLYQNAFSLIARGGFEPKTWDDLNDPSVTIAIELGSVYDLNIGKLCPKANVVRLKSNNEALLTVQAGRAHCQIIVVIFALTTLTRNPGLGHLVVPEPLFGSTTNGMLAKEADPLWRDYVDSWIDKRRGAGELRRVLVDNLGQVGVPASAVPPQLLF